jgi:hypothetical protein
MRVNVFPVSILRRHLNWDCRGTAENKRMRCDCGSLLKSPIFHVLLVILLLYSAESAAFVSGPRMKRVGGKLPQI